MKPETIEKIVKVLKIAMPKCTISYDAGPDGWCIIIGQIADDGVFYVLEEISYKYKLRGYLITREIGFFEALVEIKKPWEHGVYQRVSYIPSKKEFAEGFCSQFANAEDKDKWLEENL